MKRAVLLLLTGVITWGQSRSVTLSWTASTTPGVSYNAYRATGACTGTNLVYAKIGSTAVGILSYSDTTITVGTYCYYVTAAAAGLESVPSNTTVTVVAPVAPTGLTAVTPAVASVKTGGQVQFSANGSTAPLWSISPLLGSIGATTGLYQAPPAIQGNNLMVTVIANSTVSNEMAVASLTVRRK